MKLEVNLSPVRYLVLHYYDSKTRMRLAVSIHHDLDDVACFYFQYITRAQMV